MRVFKVMLLQMLVVLTAGAETRVDITGLRNMSEQAALEMMGGRLTHVRSSPASAPLADDAAFILREMLKQDGYDDAVVEWKIRGRDRIELAVREGVRLSLGNVEVNGVAEHERKKFARLYAKPAERDFEFGGKAPPFREEDVETGLSFLTQELKARGYWEAEARVAKRSTDSETGSVDVVIDVKRGPYFRIGAPTVIGEAPKGAESVVAPARQWIGRAASTKNLNAMRLAVEESVAGSGYPDAKIRMSQTLEGAKFIPGFSIELGERVRLGKIAIEGLERTRSERVYSRVDSMEGDWYDTATMNLRLREFLATGAFASARVETVPAGDGVIDTTLHFEEARAREIALSAGAGSYQGMITRANYIDRNLFGRLWGLNAGLEVSFLGLLGEVRVTNPWLYGSDVGGTARLYSLIYGREGYTSFESGFDGQLSWKFGKHYTVDLLAGYSIVSLSNDGLPSSVLGETDYTNPRLRITQKLDFRDNPVLPKSGWHLESPLEIGTAVGSDSTSYAMAALSGGWYHRINRKFDIGAGGRIGVLVPSGDGADLPIDLRLFNGGASSVRSFAERELGPQVNGYPTGGEGSWHTNFEVIRKISDSVQAVAFVDAGALSQRYDEILSADLEVAAGLGVRLNLPIGPVRFEYGYNLTRDDGEPAGAFHFAIGAAY